MIQYQMYIKINFHKQRGAVFAAMLLVIVLMLVTSILGINALENASVQTRIARNMQQKQASFQNAEAAIGIAEVAWVDTLVTCFNDIPNCNVDITPSYKGENVKASAFWVGKSMSVKNSVRFGDTVVEYFGARLIPGDSLREVKFYRLTSRGQEKILEADGTQNPDANVSTIIQTMLRICTRIDDGSVC